ncbi:hypothetical protein [Halomicrobium salinisoli]|uniref:hypothetical protein n=1 Tax=Halomicrobium salinisoli TaxID=2878391 RepID=UPI001CF02323|nr:hypothetical protein [Halomicrobium salinisoli]
MHFASRTLDAAGYLGAVCIFVGVVGLLVLPTLHVSAEYSIIRVLGYDGPMNHVYLVTAAGWGLGIALLKFEERIDDQS